MDSDSLKLYLDNTSTFVSGSLKGDSYKAFKKVLGYTPDDYLWRMQRNPNWDGCVSCVCYNKTYCRCAIKKDGMHFPTGLISKATQFFRDNNIGYDIFDARDPVIAKASREIPYELTDALVVKREDGSIILDDNGKPKKGKPFSLYDYQKDAVAKAVAAQRGIIKVATGGGKTVIASAIIAHLGVTPTIFYVTSMDLLKQALDEVTQYVRLNGSLLTVGAIGGGRKTIGDITIMTVQTAVRAIGEKYKKFDDEDKDDSTDIADIKDQIKDLIQSAKLIICDEVQHWRAETCQIIADNSFSCRWRYGLSATPWRDAGDDILIDACFGKAIVDIPASWLIKNDFLVKPTIAFLRVENMKGQRLGPWPSVYKQALVENEYRNKIITKLAQNLEQQNRTTLILVQQIPHGELLSTMLPGSVFLHGSCTKKAREEHIDAMKKGKAPVTIASTIFDEGIDVKPLNALILAGGGKSPTRALQRIGRVIRQYTYPDGRKKEDAFVYDFHDVQKYLTEHAMHRRKIYKSEPEFVIQDFQI